MVYCLVDTHDVTIDGIKWQVERKRQGSPVLWSSAFLGSRKLIEDRYRRSASGLATGERKYSPTSRIPCKYATVLDIAQ